ncbi:hypothetical protein NM208_g54 [Fusarium decemcellulare]|uniref:Uncharacterized protein n=1 Tax=Fusarium decemcellulare TaxID=57161 RepID=A0ACC1T106_9HYPO|nr:hypothetical protein NM208_g54 [Fusarium decemcellulare]
MDPFSIATGCAGLVQIIGCLSVQIHTFVRACRETRSDLDRVSRELLSLRTVLELIQEDATDESKPFPPTLKQHVTGIVSNCNTVVLEIQSCIEKYGDNRLKSKASWAVNGQGDITKLRSSLEAHKTALELALDMLALHLTREIKSDTTELRSDTAAIKDDTAQILEEIARLQARLPKETSASAPNDFILQRFLEEMTTYTEQALDVPLSDEDDEDDDVDSLALSHTEEENSTNALEERPRDQKLHSTTVRNTTATQEDGPRSDQSLLSKHSKLSSSELSPTQMGEAELSKENSGPSPTLVKSNATDASEDMQHLTFRGNLILDLQVSPSILNYVPHGERDEFTHCRFFARYNRSALFRPRSVYLATFAFTTRWSFLVETIQELTDKLQEMEGAPAEPWKQILVHMDGPTNWGGLDRDIRSILHQIGALHNVDEILGGLDKPTVLGKKVYHTIQEYTIRIRPSWLISGIRPILLQTPIQVISTAPCGRTKPRRREYSYNGSYNWGNAIAKVLEPDLVIKMPTGPKSEWTPKTFLYQAWISQKKIDTYRAPGTSGTIFLTLEELRNIIEESTLSTAVFRFAKRLFSSE